MSFLYCTRARSGEGRYAFFVDSAVGQLGAIKSEPYVTFCNWDVGEN
jgi:hypothetical protein